MKNQKKKALKNEVLSQARPLGRPSAAAAGFTTMGLSDAEVDRKIALNKDGKSKPKGKAAPKKLRPCTRKEKAQVNVKKNAKEKGEDAKLDKEESNDDSQEDEVKVKEKVQPGTWSVRKEFPKSNIRRWTTPGSRFAKPDGMPSMEAVRLAKLELEMNELPKPSPMSTSGKDCGKEKEEPKDQPKPPRHRHRTKSARVFFAFMFSSWSNLSIPISARICWDLFETAGAMFYNGLEKK